MIATELSRLLLTAVLVAAPWFRGAAFRAPQAWLYWAIAVAVGLRLCSTTSQYRRVPLPLGAALIGIPLALFQLWPLSHDALQTLAPTAAHFRNEPTPQDETPILGAVDPAILGATTNSLAPLSIAPARTADQLAQLIVACSAFWLTLELFPGITERRRLLVIIVVNGAALAFVALAQKLGDRTFSFWVPHSNWFGPFGNRNNGAGYVNMCFAACCGWLWYQLPQPTPGREPLDGRSDRRKTIFTPALTAAAAAAVLMAASVAASLSRGALLSLTVGLIAAGAVVGILQGRRRLLLWFSLCLLGAAGLVHWLGLMDVVQKRVTTLTHTAEVAQDGRLANWRWGLPTARAFLPWGSGLGTYAYAYPPFQQVAAGERFLYPENALLQTAVEAGVPGTVCFVAGFFAALTIAVNLLRRENPALHAFGVMGLLLLTTQGVHSCLDNGFYLPANMLLLAALCATFCSEFAATATGAAAAEKPTAASARESRFSAVSLHAGLAVCLLLGTTWACSRQFLFIDAEQALSNAERIGNDPQVDAETIAAHLAALEQAQVRAEDSAPLQRRCAELFMLLYQRRAADELVNSGVITDRTVAWTAAASAALFATTARLEREGDESGLQSMRNHPVVLRFLVPAWQHLHRAHVAAPTDAATATYLGELHFLVGAPAQARHWFLIATELAPARPAILFRNGVNLSSARELGQAAKVLQACWRLDPAYADRICALVPERLTLGELIENVVPRQRAALKFVDSHFFRNDGGGASERSRLQVLLQSLPKQP